MLVGNGWLTGGWWSEQVRISGEGSVTGGQLKYAAATPAKIT